MKQKPKSTASQVASVVNLPGYEIKDVLGKGGMAVVYLAVQESIGRQVALKILAPDHTDETFTDRFLAEARIISSLNHPNIVTVYDAGVHQGCHYMSMEYVPGKNLRDARDLLSRKQKIGIIKQMAQALDYAGKKGYVHRDIKPENILLHEDGRAILTDFGIARSLDATRGLTVTGKTIGTPYYMSPEQTKGLKVDHRSDIYSLGVVLFQCLAGYIPYDGPSMVAIGIKHISEPIPELPPGLEIFQPIINICLSKDPDHRYATAGDFFQALDAIPEAELDYIDAKADALKKKGKDYHARTMVSEEVSAPQYSQQPVVSRPQTPRTATPRSTTSLDITESDDFKRLRKRRRWLLFLVFALLLGGLGYMQRDRLNNLWQTRVQPQIESWMASLESAQTTPSSPVAETPPDTTAPPQPTAPQNSPAPEITLANQPDILQQVETRPELIAPLTKEYRALLAHNPQDQLGLDGMEQLGKWYILQIRASVDEQNTTTARKLISEARQNLGADFVPQPLLLIEQQLLRQEAIQSHLEKAQEYFARGDYLVPAGANALDEWQAVLAIDPAHQEALAGIDNITQLHLKTGQQQYRQGKLHEALATVELGLTADTQHEGLLTLKKTLAREIEKQNRILSRLIQAEAQFQAGKVIQPTGESAYDLYNAVLKEDGRNKKASEGLRKIEVYLNRQINTAIWENKLKQAGDILNQGLARYPNSALLDKTRDKLQNAITSRAPRITHMLYSDAPLGSLLKEQSVVNPTQRLHFGFTYNNFTSSTSLLTATIVGENNRPIQKKLIVSDKSGEHLFHIDHPSGLFAAGQYRLKIDLQSQTVLDTVITISIPNAAE